MPRKLSSIVLGSYYLVKFVAAQRVEQRRDWAADEKSVGAEIKIYFRGWVSCGFGAKNKLLYKVDDDLDLPTKLVWIDIVIQMNL